jgi:hypothetical protein
LSLSVIGELISGQAVTNVASTQSVTSGRSYLRLSIIRELILLQAIVFPPSAMARGFMTKDEILQAGIYPHRVPIPATSTTFYAVTVGRMIGVYDNW